MKTLSAAVADATVPRSPGAMSESGGSLAKQVELSLEQEEFLRVKDPIVAGSDSDADDEDAIVSPPVMIVPASVFKAVVAIHGSLNYTKPLLKTVQGIDKTKMKPILDVLKTLEKKYFAKIPDAAKRAICHASISSTGIRWRVADDVGERCALSGKPATHQLSVELDPIYTAVQWCMLNVKKDLALAKVEVAPESVSFPIAKNQIKTVCALAIMFAYANAWTIVYKSEDADFLAVQFDKLHQLLTV